MDGSVCYVGKESTTLSQISLPCYARLLIEEVAKFVGLVVGLTCKLRGFVTIRYTHREGGEGRERVECAR